VVDDSNFAVPDDLSALSEARTPSAAERAAARAFAVGMLRRALNELGLFVPAGQFPSYRPAQADDGSQDADIERGVLAGILIAVGERAALGTDLIDVAAGYEFAARDLDGPHTGPSEDTWRRTILERARLSSVITRRPYPQDVAVPNEACRAGDDAAHHTAQAAVHAAAARFLLQIPADVFAGGPVDAITEVKASIAASSRTWPGPVAYRAARAAAGRFGSWAAGPDPAVAAAATRLLAWFPTA
jgi:hypothetical protein